MKLFVKARCLTIFDKRLILEVVFGLKFFKNFSTDKTKSDACNPTRARSEKKISDLMRSRSNSDWMQTRKANSQKNRQLEMESKRDRHETQLPTGEEKNGKQLTASLSLLRLNTLRKIL